MDGRRDSFIARKPVPSVAAHPAGTGYQAVNPVEPERPANSPAFLTVDGRPRSSLWWTLLGDALLAIPGAAFLVYAIMVTVNNGRPVKEDPLPMLIDASRYGPTIFPIAFAAVAANVLKSYAAWKLERGITLLDLEYLLGSRTVFSAFTAPFALRTLSFLAPALMALWALSPLGGQAALRVMMVVPNTAFEPQNFQWLEFMSQFSHFGVVSAAAAEVVPAAIGAFSAALSSPLDVKKAPRDMYGNLKIPMVEVYQDSDKVEADPDGWYVVHDLEDVDTVRYSSLAGLAITSQDDLTQLANYSLTIDTSYLYTSCNVSHTTGMGLGDWVEHKNETISRIMSWTNGETLTMYPGNNHTMFSDFPFELVLESWTSNAVTNAKCSFTMSYVQAEISCHQSDCEAVRVRPVTRAQNVTVLTVLDGNGPGDIRYLTIPPNMAFWETFSKAGMTYFNGRMWATDQYSSPVEYYFTNPGSPYMAFMDPDTGYRGADIYPIGNAMFSYRFTQLVNTMWITTMAPSVVTGGLEFNATLFDNPTLKESGMLVGNAAGTVTPDMLIMRPDTPWLVVLFVSSAIMLIAAIVAATLGVMREGPDVLDRATSFLEYNHQAGSLVRTNTAMSMQTPAWKEQQIRLGFKPEAGQFEPEARRFEQDSGWTLKH